MYEKHLRYISKCFSTRDYATRDSIMFPAVLFMTHLKCDNFIIRRSGLNDKIEGKITGEKD